MFKDYKVCGRNSTVCGYPGRNYDWSKFCWDGSQVFKLTKRHKGEKCYLPWVDTGLIREGSQYLHVPYNWVEDSTIYRVRPNESMRSGEVYHGHKILKQTAVKKDDGFWYWRLEF
jgi:hypothetical protein